MRTKSLRIGEVAAGAGVGIDTVRYYERRGVLPPIERRSSGYRSFRPETVERIGFVKELQALGFSLDEVIELLKMIDSNARTCETARGYALATIDRIDVKIRALSQTRERLASLLQACDGEDCGPLADVTPRVRLPLSSNGSRQPGAHRAHR